MQTHIETAENARIAPRPDAERAGSGPAVAALTPAQERVAKIEALIEGGATASEIAAVFGIHANHMYSVIFALELKAAKPKTRPVYHRRAALRQQSNSAQA